MGSVLAAVAAAAAVLTHSAATASRTPTLLYHHAGTVAAFAQDGPDVAWFEAGGTKCNTVHLLELTDGLHATLPDQNHHNVTCHFAWDPQRPVGLALAQKGGRALWTLPQQSPLQLDYLLGAGLAAGDRPERRFLEVAHTARGVGQWLGGISGDKGTLVYGVTSVDYEDEAGCLAGTNPDGCRLIKSGGGVYWINGRTAQLVKNTGAAVAVAASGGAVAYVATGAIARDGQPVASADLPIDIRDVSSGDQISSVQPQGVPIALALSDRVLATLERTPLGLRLAWYDRTTGQPKGSVPVPKTTAPALTASDSLIVFHVGRSLRSVAVDSHRVRVLAKTPSKPIGLSLEGDRLAWAENARRQYWIRALYVSGNG
ncbi:MAG: hypothetical protein ABUS54_03210 [Actinomycetota bacterium]